MISLMSAALRPSRGTSSPTATSIFASSLSAAAASTSVMTMCPPSPARLAVSRRFDAGVTHAIDHAVRVIAHQQRAVFGDGEPGGPANLRFAAVHEKTCQEIFKALGLSVAKHNADHFVSG